jgi:hypothetical protein
LIKNLDRKPMNVLESSELPPAETVENISAAPNLTTYYGV